MYIERNLGPSQSADRSASLLGDTYSLGPNFEDSLARNYPTTKDHLTFFPERLNEILGKIPKLEDVQTGRRQLEVNKITEKPYAMDLRDELRHVRELLNYGIDPEMGWENFKTLSEYYASESYAKYPETHYRHELVYDANNQKLRLWIGSHNMLASDSYGLAIEKGGPEWYQSRCLREFAGVSDWEGLLQQGVDQSVIVDVSPAPFEVSTSEVEGTSFGNHSFVRFHQIVDVDKGSPYVHSVAFRVRLPPAYLEKITQQLTDEKERKWTDLLGKFFFSNQSILGDIRDEKWASSVKSYFEKISTSVPLKDRLIDLDQDTSRATPQEMADYFQYLEPFLHEAYSKIVDAAVSINDSYLYEALKLYQGWEKMLKAHINGEWKMQFARHNNQNQHRNEYDNPEFMLQHIMRYYQTQTYQEPVNSCGGGSGVGEVLEVNSGTRTVLSDLMFQGGSDIFLETKVGCEETGCNIHYPHFHCPDCEGHIRSGKGIDQCPHCGLKKSDYRGEKCD